MTTAARLATAAAVALVCLIAPDARAGWVDRAVRAERRVWSMPLERRPNRLGHFYGNNVRRLRSGRWLVNYGRYDRPVARYLYMP